MISQEERKAVIDLFPFLGNNPVIIDAGSNKGHFIDVVLEEYKDNCTIHAIEPNDKLRSFTEIKFEYFTNITYYQYPFYKESSVLQFHYFENFNNELSSIYNGGKDWDGLPIKTKSVQCVTLDDYCAMKNIDSIDYLKIDVEGADLDVLIGSSGMMGKIGIIQIEYSEHWRRGGHTFKEMFDFANKHGYSIYRYEAKNFWKIDSVPNLPNFDNYYLSKFELHNFSVGGWNDNFVMNTADLPKMGLVVEIGAMEGMTTKYICENLLNDSQDARVIVIDPLYDYYVKDDPRYHPEFINQYQRFLRNTRGLTVNLHRGESKDELPKLNALRADLVYIDGNHYSPWPYYDGSWSFAITKVGGYILFDDYNLWDEGTKGSIDKFLKEFDGAYEVVRSNYQILIKKTSNRYNELTQSYYL